MRNYQRLICAGLLASCSQMGFAVDSITIGYAGGEPNNLTGVRVGVQWDWHKQWLKTENWSLGGYWDLSASHFWTNGGASNQNHSISGISGVPMFRYQRKPYSNTIAPFIEIGVGAALLDQTKIGSRNLSTNFQFDDRIGFGIRFGNKQQFGIGYQLNHMSNARIKTPNNGIDLTHVIRFSYYFK